MLKQNLLKTVSLAAIAFCILLSEACTSKPINENTEPSKLQENTEIKNDNTSPTAAPTEAHSEHPSSSPEYKSDVIEKITGGADETGIYAIVITLSDKAADKGVVEMVYYGPKGSPQENSIVNTFRIEYYKEASGTFEIYTFYDGDAYQNFHHKDKVKVNHTFGAAIRARNVIISYTPDGGETQEIYRADAEQFYISAN